LINFYTSLAKARLARLSGQLPLAREILDNLRTQANLSVYMTMLLETEWGCYLLCCGRAAEAVETLSETLLAWGQTDQYKLEQGIARLWQAAAMSQLAPDDAIANLEDFLTHTANTLISGPLCVTAIQIRRWLEKPLQSKKGSEQLENFFAQAEKYVESISNLRRRLRQISKRIEMSRPHLEIYTFGAARVVRNGKVLAISDWQTRETRDLFFYFISHPPQTKEEIANVFWPDISPARLKMRFKTSIYRLRQALGQDVILFEDDHYRFNKTIDYTCDRENFEHLIGLAQSAATTEETISLLEKSIDLISGSYLSDIDADWTMEERAHLESVHQSTLLYLANLYLQVGRARLSLKVCQRALTADPLNEQAHRISMQAYVALRDRSGLIHQFEKCREKLEEELGIGPSRETEKLYERLIDEF
jgi:two-component SAPR family response regulator